MTKYEFARALREALEGFPLEDTERSVDFYCEMIADRMEEGLTEEEAVAAVGAVEQIAAQIRSEGALNGSPQKSTPEKGVRKGWKVALLIVSSPVWLSLLVAAVAVVLSVYIVLWAAVISLYAAAASCVACGVAGLLGSCVYFSRNNLPGVAFSAGAGLLCLGVAIFLMIGSVKATKALIWFTKKLPGIFKTCFIRKEEAR